MAHEAALILFRGKETTRILTIFYYWGKEHARMVSKKPNQPKPKTHPNHFYWRTPLLSSIATTTSLSSPLPSPTSSPLIISNSNAPTFHPPIHWPPSEPTDTVQRHVSTHWFSSGAHVRYFNLQSLPSQYEQKIYIYHKTRTANPVPPRFTRRET